MRANTKISFFIFAILCVSNALLAQAPDFVYRIRSNDGTGGPHSSWTTATSSWSIPASATVGNISISDLFSGMPAGDNITLTLSSNQIGDAIGASSTRLVKYEVGIYSKYPGTVDITSDLSGGVIVDGTSNYSRSASCGLMPSDGTTISASLAGGASGSDSDTIDDEHVRTVTVSCSTGAVTFTEYPSVNYYHVRTEIIFVSTILAGNFDGEVDAEVVASFSMVLGSDEPKALIDTPIISSTNADGNAELGASVTFDNISYDPDDSSTILDGICDYQWTIYDPNGVIIAQNSTNTTFGFTASKTGTYYIQLDVTDNEGDTSTIVKKVPAGPKRKPQQNKEPSCHSDPNLSTGANAGTGNASTNAGTTYDTGGDYPLHNSVSMNTQGGYTGGGSGNGAANAFTPYEMHVETAPNASSVNTRYVVAADGQELDYGPASGSPTAGDGTYGTLTAITGGYELTGAGAPTEMDRPGNFTYEFNSIGKLVKITTPAGNEQAISYDGSGNLDTVTDVSSGKTLTYTYNGSGYISKVEGPGSELHLSYTADLLTDVELKNTGGTTTLRSFAFTYNDDDLIETVTKDGDASTEISYSYSDGGNGVFLANIVYPGGSTDYTYGTVPSAGADFTVLEENSKGQTITHDYDERGNLLKSTYPVPSGAGSAPTMTYTYDSDDNMLTSSDGATTYTYTYDAGGHLIEVEDQTGKFIEYTWSGNNLTQIEDNTGILKEFTYGSGTHPNLPTVVTDGEGEDWTYAYNSAGQLTSITPPTGSSIGTVTFTYDTNSMSPTYRLLTEIENGAGESITFDDYDANGNATEISTYPTGIVTNTSTFEYDEAGRLTRREFDDGKDIDYIYTGRDLTTVTDEAGSDIDYEYCPGCGKLTGVDEPLSRSYSWNLDTDFDETSFTDPRSKTTTYTLGNMKELKEIVFPDGKKYIYTYDDYGRLKSSTYPGSTKGDITRDGSGNVTAVTYTGDTNNNLSYTYYNDNLMATSTSRLGTVTYTYDGEKRVESVSHDYSTYNSVPNQLHYVQLLEYDYNPDGTLSSLTWKSDGTTVASWSYTYDGAGRVTAISNNFSESLAYTYDDEGKILTQSNGNGTSTEYTYYEPRGWVTDIEHFDVSSTLFESFEMEYDGGSNTVGNITSVTELSTDVVDYTYDALYRLTEEDRSGASSYTRTYGYDVAGNVTTFNGSTFAGYNDANRISSITGGSVSYHSSGNPYQVSGTGISCGRFNFNARGELGQQKDCSNNNTISTIYDGRGKRSYRSGRFFIFDGDRVVGEIKPDGTPQMAYTWGSDGLAIQRDLVNSTTSYYHYGPQGETRHLTNSSGTVTDSYRFSAYGVPLYTSGSTNNYHKYGGKYGYYTEGVTGIILAGARAYHPYLMRWLQRDPIGIEGGINLYEYVKSNPMRYFDATGYKPEESILGPVTQPAGAIADFCQSYFEMLSANFIGQDKYFHCKANCKAAKRGQYGRNASVRLSNLREAHDTAKNNIKSYLGIQPRKDDGEEDQKANAKGRGVPDGISCESWCEPYRPKDDEFPGDY